MTTHNRVLACYSSSQNNALLWWVRRPLCQNILLMTFVFSILFMAYLFMAKLIPAPEQIVQCASGISDPDGHALALAVARECQLTFENILHSFFGMSIMIMLLCWAVSRLTWLCIRILAIRFGIHPERNAYVAIQDSHKVYFCAAICFCVSLVVGATIVLYSGSEYGYLALAFSLWMFIVPFLLYYAHSSLRTIKNFKGRILRNRSRDDFLIYHFFENTIDAAIALILLLVSWALIKQGLIPSITNYESAAIDKCAVLTSYSKYGPLIMDALNETIVPGSLETLVVNLMDAIEPHIPLWLAFSCYIIMYMPYAAISHNLYSIRLLLVGVPAILILGIIFEWLWSGFEGTFNHGRDLVFPALIVSYVVGAYSETIVHRIIQKASDK